MGGWDCVGYGLAGGLKAVVGPFRIGRWSLAVGRWPLLIILLFKLLGFSPLAFLFPLFLVTLPLATYSWLLIFHGVNQLKKLGAVYYFDEGLALGLVADHIDRRSVIDADTLAQIFVLSDAFGELALRIDRKGQINFVVGGELFSEGSESGRRDLGLVLEDVVAEVVAELLGVSVEVARDESGVVRPVVHGQREVVAHDRNFVRFGGFLDEGRGAATVRALQVLEHDDGDLGAFRRSQRGVDVLSGDHGSDEEESQGKNQVVVAHNLIGCRFFLLHFCTRYGNRSGV